MKYKCRKVTSGDEVTFKISISVNKNDLEKAYNTREEPHLTFRPHRGIDGDEYTNADNSLLELRLMVYYLGLSHSKTVEELINSAKKRQRKEYEARARKK